MSMVGEQFDEYSSEVNGVVLQRRARNDRLAIWVADTNNLNSVQSIGFASSNFYFRKIVLYYINALKA